MKKLVLAVGTILLLSLPAMARQRAFGYCSIGGQKVKTQGINSANFWQQSYPACTVTVYQSGTTNLAVIYADNSGTLLQNPFSSSSSGYWYFYADNGRYDVHFSNSGITIPYTQGDYLLCDPSDPTGSFDCSGGTSSMIFPPGTGIPTVTGGTAWGTTLAQPSGDIVGTTDTQTLTNKTLDGVTPTVFGFLDATSSIQTQLNAKSPISSPSFTGTVTLPITGSTQCLHVDTSGVLSGTGSDCGSGGGGGVTSLTGDGTLITNSASTGAVTLTLGKTIPTGDFVGTTDTQTLTNKTVDGVAPATFGFLDATSSIQSQLNAKAPTASPNFTGTVTIPVTGSTQCLHVNTSGAISGTGVDCGSTGGMIFPSGSGIAIVSGGSAWGTTVAAPTGTVVGTTDTQTLTNKTLDGVSPATMAFVDPTSSIQTQLNSKVNYPSGTGLVVVTSGSSWGTTRTAPTGTVVGTTDTQTLTNKTIDGVSPTTMGFVDPTSSIQTQINTKAPSASPTFTGTVTVPVLGSTQCLHVDLSGAVSGTGFDCGTGGGGMIWPGAAGIAVYSGTSSWGTSLTAPTGNIVGTTDTQTLTNKTLDGVTPTIFGYLDATSSIQTQLNAKAPSNNPTFTGNVTLPFAPGSTRCLNVSTAGVIGILGTNCFPSSAGIAVSTGSAWGSSLTAPTGTIVGTTDTQTLTNKTVTGPQLGTTYNAANMTGADAAAKINACLTAASGNGTCVAQGLSGASLSQINVPSNSHLIMRGNSLTFSGTGISIGSSSNVIIEGDNSTQITGSVNTAVSITTGSHILVENLGVSGYNSSNTTGNAGFMIFGASSDVTFLHDSASSGKGQCFRMDSASGLPNNTWILNNICTLSTGSSSEGIGPMGNNTWVIGNYVYKTGATGILVYNGRAGTTFSNIFIENNSIGDTSQVAAGNAGIQLNPTSNAIQNIVVSGNNVFDDQGVATTEVMLSLTNGASTGTITGLFVTGNTHTSTINSSAISNSIVAADLTNFLANPLITTVAQLGSFAVKGQIATVTDGASTTDCTVGLGSTAVPCIYDGTAWQSIVSGGGGGMVYPSAGIPVSTGSAWTTSKASPTGTIVGTTDTQTLTNKTIDGVTPTTMGFVDPTSSIQTQLNGKLSSTPANVTTSVGTSAIAANTCNTTTTVAMTGLTTSMTLNFTPTSDVSGVTGWGGTGGLAIDAWPTANTVNYRTCNQTAASITPSSTVTFNVSAR